MYALALIAEIDIDFDLGSVPAWIAAIASFVSVGILLLTIRYARKNIEQAKGALEDARRTRHGQLTTDLIRQWTEPAAIEARALYGSGKGKYTAQGIVDLVERLYRPPVPKPSKRDQSDFSMLSLWANQVEFIGVLASENAITPGVIYKMWGGGILTAWKAWEPAVMKLREYDKEPDTYQYFEEIVLEMKRISRQREQAAAISLARDPQAGAGVEPQNTAQKQPFFSPPSGTPNRSASVTRRVVQFVAAALAVSAIVEAVRRRRPR